MEYKFLATASMEDVQEGIATLVEGGARSVQMLGTVADEWTPEKFDGIITAAGVPVFGGLFPGILHDGRKWDQGMVLIGHDQEAVIKVLPCENWTREHLAAMDEAATVFVYFDATCPTGDLVVFLYEELGAAPVWLGGGAGALDFVRRPVVITPEGLKEGVAVVAGFETASRVGVTHGWEPIGESLRVTSARGNDVLTLDWRPAFEVYREAVEEHSGRSFEDEDFFSLASTYPFLLERMDSEGIVRDPLAVLPDGGMRCAGEVPEHGMLRVAHGSMEGMLKAASAAREEVLQEGMPESGMAFTIDCISRSLVLGERLEEELEALKIAGLPQVGALTLGEIANGRRQYLQLHNKTTVIAIFE